MTSATGIQFDENGQPILICDVCDKNVALGVAAMPGVPISFAYCRECIQANAHPYGIVVANTGMCGGMGDVAGWWLDIVDGTLKHLNIPRKQFDEDVVKFIKDMEEEEANMQEESSD